MTGAIVGAALLLAIVVVVATAYAVSKSRAGDRQPGRPDELSDEVVAGLLAELRKWQAEAAHWKATADRLQRELDGRA